jgi:ParB family chromosome partitioning protein
MAKPALGRGLGALLGGSPALLRPPIPTDGPAPPTPAPAAPLTAALPVPVAPGERLLHVPLAKIRPCPFQPRKDFPPESLRELADSIRAQGIVQPLVVRRRGNEFELIAGERRWRAAQLLGLPEVPVVLRDADDRTALELALIENLQRENLNPIEEAQGFAQLIEQFQFTQEEAAGKVGKSRVVVTNALRLLKLPAGVQNYLRDGRLSVGHAKVILGLATEKLQTRAAERAIKEGLNVRQIEHVVTRLQAREAGARGKPAPLGTRAPDAHVASLEDRLRERLGTKVQVRYNKGKGALEIAFYSDAELERILQILGVTSE